MHTSPPYSLRAAADEPIFQPFHTMEHHGYSSYIKYVALMETVASKGCAQVRVTQASRARSRLRSRFWMQDIYLTLVPLRSCGRLTLDILMRLKEL